jgi:hypothetical protein
MVKTPIPKLSLIKNKNKNNPSCRNATGTGWQHPSTLFT